MNIQIGGGVQKNLQPQADHSSSWKTQSWIENFSTFSGERRYRYLQSRKYGSPVFHWPARWIWYETSPQWKLQKTLTIINNLWWGQSLLFKSCNVGFRFTLHFKIKALSFWLPRAIGHHNVVTSDQRCPESLKLLTDLGFSIVKSSITKKQLWKSLYFENFTLFDKPASEEMN